jgi:hypothetical protein
LIHANPSKPFVLDMDAFGFALGIVLSQPRKDNYLHLIGFYFCKFSPNEINYEIHHKKNLAIMDAFEEWCHLLEGAQHDMSLLVMCP